MREKLSDVGLHVKLAQTYGRACEQVQLAQVPGIGRPGPP